MIILFPYADVFDTLSYFIHKATVLSEKVPVIFAPCKTEDSYDTYLKALWNYQDDLVILEHDIHADIEDIMDLFYCPHPLCARAYEINHSDIPAGTIAHRNLVKHPAPDNNTLIQQWIKSNEEWADLVGFGLTKIGRMFRKAYPPEWSEDYYPHRRSLSLDSRFCYMTNELGFRWHIHWPIIHHSKKFPFIKHHYAENCVDSNCILHGTKEP